MNSLVAFILAWIAADFTAAPFNPVVSLPGSGRTAPRSLDDDVDGGTGNTAALVRHLRAHWRDYPTDEEYLTLWRHGFTDVASEWEYESYFAFFLSDPSYAREPDAVLAEEAMVQADAALEYAAAVADEEAEEEAYWADLQYPYMEWDTDEVARAFF